MDDGSGNGVGSFKVVHRPDAAEVTNVYKTGVGEVGDVVTEKHEDVIILDLTVAFPFFPSIQLNRLLLNNRNIEAIT